MADSNVTDAGLAHLQGATNLHRLNLANTKVTDAGLANLKGLTQLDWLNLAKTMVTDTGVKAAPAGTAEVQDRPQRRRVTHYRFFSSRRIGDSTSVRIITSSPVDVLISWCRLKTLMPVA